MGKRKYSGTYGHTYVTLVRKGHKSRLYANGERVAAAFGKGIRTSAIACVLADLRAGALAPTCADDVRAAYDVAERIFGGDL